ncbi:MAG TPA: SpoIIE family protein phosphatase [Spirochaetota bacterium]|nr:SpoIIE family protein phosphatase [Spirochaetota bacterium]HOL56994.1 SpoIIE family protein phosphatase [Spirochaetota bacterium]HPP03834.1 SpoIIE family protein phosphatase [Spirochaetota bacterium]
MSIQKIESGKNLLNIRTQLLIIIIPIAIIPLIIIVNLVINRIFVHLEKQSRDYYYTILEQVANNLNFVYNQYARTLSNMIEIPEVVQGLTHPPYRSKEEERLVSNNIIGDVNTRGGLRNTVEEKIEGAVFIYEMDRKSLINETDYKIHYVSSANIGPGLKEIINDPLFQKLKENKEKLIFGRFKDYIFPDGKQRAVIIFPYYKNNEEDFTKFILITLFPDFIPKFYSSITTLNYGTLYILDRFNNILSQNHPGEDDLYSYDSQKKRYYLEPGDQKSYGDMSFNDYLVLNTDENILKTEKVKEILDKLDNEEIDALSKQQNYIIHNGIKYLIVTGFENATKCKFVYFHPVIQIQRPIYNIISIIIVITIFIVIIVIIISLILSKTFTNPIMKLSEASLKIAKGDYNFSININGNKEINILSEAFNKMVREIKDYTENLEKMVEQRTNELKDAHERLKLAHQALWGEMELAKKIQISLLPISPSISGYDISAKMIAAKEVGGDFYDIATYNNRNIITIGDVSGHGVTPGLITMIIQTIISSIMTENKNISLKELYSYLNKLLIKSIKKLDVRMFATISILEEVSEGEFIGCGKHNDIIIYRKDKREIELIETKGIWLGISEYGIENYIQEYKFDLNVDDVMLLYTDGLSEISDSDGNMFEKRLKELLIENCDKDSNEILDAILREFEEFRNSNFSEFNNDDDVTLLVIKKI